MKQTRYCCHRIGIVNMLHHLQEKMCARYFNYLLSDLFFFQLLVIIYVDFNSQSLLSCTSRAYWQPEKKNQAGQQVYNKKASCAACAWVLVRAYVHMRVSSARYRVHTRIDVCPSQLSEPRLKAMEMASSEQRGIELARRPSIYPDPSSTSLLQHLQQQQQQHQVVSCPSVSELL